jgi:hypothetical protein
VRTVRALKSSITGEVVAEALSSLDSICLEDQPTSSIEKFVAVYQLPGRTVIVVDTEVEFDRRQVLRRKIRDRPYTLRALKCMYCLILHLYEFYDGLG